MAVFGVLTLVQMVESAEMSPWESAEESIMRLESANIANELIKSIEK